MHDYWGKKELFLLWKPLDLALNFSACNITYIPLSKPKLSRYKLQHKDFYILNAYSHTQIWIVLGQTYDLQAYIISSIYHNSK